MCEVSDKLQLCSCAKVDIDNAKHYWVYYRFVKGQEIELMGLTMMPVEIDEKTDLYNRVLLKKLLNEKAVFDKPIRPKKGDMLKLSLHVKNESQKLTYGFKYTKGKWEEEEYDFFLWAAQHKETKYGKIKNAIKNKND